MKASKVWITVGLVALLAVMAGGAGALSEPMGPEAVVAGKINYQGRLTDTGGTPLNGDYDMQFRIYDALNGGTLLWDSGLVSNVPVDDGLFNVALSVDPADFNGQGLWLQMQVEGEWLTPRQELLPVPYALSLRPGAEVSGEPTAWTGYVLKANMEGAFPLANALLGSTATGTAVRGESAGGYGLQAYSGSSYGLWSHSDTGVGGQISSSEGYGLQVESNGDDHWDHAGIFGAFMGYGLYAQSRGNMAVVGEAGNVSGFWRPGGKVGVVGIGEDRGVFGSSQDREGVYGISVTDNGVYGETEDNDYYNTAGVYGAKWSGDGTAVRGLKYGDAGIAIYGTNWGNTGSAVVGNSIDYIGVFGESDNYRGVHGVTNRGDHNYGLYTPDNLYSLNTHLRGATMHVVQNGGDEALEPGDVVVFSGMAAPLADGDPPVVQVARADAAHSTAVAGVVFSRFNIEAVTGAEDQPAGENSKAHLEVTPEGSVSTSEHLLIVVQGPALVKASALSGPIQAGDLLSSAGDAGYAAPAAQVQVEGIALTPPGTVLGKALEPLDGKQGLIYVFVTLD